MTEHPVTLEDDRIVWSFDFLTETDEFLSTMNLSLPEPLIEGIILTEKELIFDLALGLYVDRRATLGQAARLAGMSRPAFLDALGARQIPIHYDEADFEADLQVISQLGATAPTATE